MMWSTTFKRWGATTLACGLLVAGCGGDGGDGGDGGGETDADESGATSETVTMEDFSIAANTVCEGLTAPITEDPASYADVADELEQTPAPDDEVATELVTAMRAFVTAYDALVERIDAIEDFESPPGTWLITEDGNVFISRTGSVTDTEDSGIPQTTGQEFIDAQQTLSDAAWQAEAPSCEAVVAAPTG